MVATPEPAPAGRGRVRAVTSYPLDEAALLVGVPVWTRDNDFLEAPDWRPSQLANHILLTRYHAPYLRAAWVPR